VRTARADYRSSPREETRGRARFPRVSSAGDDVMCETRDESRRRRLRGSRNDEARAIISAALSYLENWDLHYRRSLSSCRSDVDYSCLAPIRSRLPFNFFLLLSHRPSRSVGAQIWQFPRKRGPRNRVGRARAFPLRNAFYSRIGAE